MGGGGRRWDGIGYRAKEREEIMDGTYNEPLEGSLPFPF